MEKPPHHALAVEQGMVEFLQHGDIVAMLTWHELAALVGFVFTRVSKAIRLSRHQARYQAGGMLVIGKVTQGPKARA